MRKVAWLGISFVFACQAVPAGEPSDPQPAAPEAAPEADAAEPDPESEQPAAPAPAERTRVTGTAWRTKLAPSVRDDDGRVIYCMGLDDWPDEVNGQRVTVEGVLEKTDDYAARVDPDGSVSQGTAGGDLVLRECTVVTPAN